MSKALGEEFVSKTLEHFGVRGMKWGRRKDKGNSALGNKPDDSSEDAKNAIEIATRVAKSGGTHTLSNRELQTLVNRINLEQNFARLQTAQAQKTSPMKTGMNYVSGKIAKTADTTVDAILKTAVQIKVQEELRKKLNSPVK